VHSPKARLNFVRTLSALLIAASTVGAFAQVGMQRLSSAPAAAPVLIWYPTTETAVTRHMGPYQVTAALGAPPTGSKLPLAMLTHGTGGHELAHAWLASKLAASGWVVVTPRAPRDNWKDRSGLSEATYFVDRPRQLSAQLDAVLSDPRWSALIDVHRVVAIGHSAGGHSVLAMAGATVDATRWLNHCSTAGRGLQEDAGMCRLAGFGVDRPASAADRGTGAVSVRDPRVKAVVGLAPMTRALDVVSLRAIPVPLHLEVPLRDELLNSTMHGQELCEVVPKVSCWMDRGAGHFASFHPGTGPIGGGGVEPAHDPDGFDRVAWQAVAGDRILRFLTQSLN